MRSICNQQDDENPAERYFVLSDLWKSLEETSAYGVPTEVVVPRGIKIQYFAPLLSAIQLYTKKPFCATSSDSGTHNEMHNNEQGYLYFEYFETTPTEDGMPIVDKVRNLATNFAGLESLRSTELSPASWLSIYWHNIYWIDEYQQIENSQACFLTFHKLSPPLQDELEVLSLRPFGLATLKANGALWKNPETGDGVLAATLHDAAVTWLAERGVDQARYPDFISFFPGR
ncbi:plant/protein (DUF789) [Rhynchospora pubera]|uniref:Plant/protein (DUF789) n=1 Tax=Rhynchospora pubera TaxID=906938 RepID=A0AAV8BSW2_9POAL|nr:plant/protein (DUF789) [Rhynchospora pubera]